MGGGREYIVQESLGVLIMSCDFICFLWGSCCSGIAEDHTWYAGIGNRATRRRWVDI